MRITSRSRFPLARRASRGSVEVGGIGRTLRGPWKWLVHIPLLVLAVYALGPLLLLLLNSIKSDDEIKGNPISLPTSVHLDNFINAWNAAGYTFAFRNSLIVTLCTVILVCILGGMAAYALVELDLPGAQFMGLYYLVASTTPAILYLMPLFAIWNRLGLVNSLQGIIIIYSAIYTPFSIFLLRSYFVRLPRELNEAARLDGASELGVLTRIVMPLSWPAFASVGLIVGVWSWNEFIFAVTFLHTTQSETVAVRYYAFVGQYVSNFAYMVAAGVIMILPAVIAFLALQRRFIEGLTSGAFKGA